MKFSEAVVSILVAEGITDAFGIPGAGINSLYKALSLSEKISHYTVRHEEAAAHAASAYCRASGKLVVCLTTSGPGATNLLTGQAVTAQMDKDAFQCVNSATICEPICD